MFVHPRRLKTQGVVAIATTVGALAFVAACGDQEARTDLRPEGDPEVLAVLVLNDSVGGLVEAATFCKENDEKRPGIVGLPDFTTTQVCPEELTEGMPELTDAAPEQWYVRLMFDELLDPNVEDLIEIFDDDGQTTNTFEGSLASTQPVTLKCAGVDGAMHPVPYDGYYSPSGNNVTWPLGPSLVIQQTGEFLVPTGAQCEIEVKDTVKDKSGNPVPMDQRGPFKFKVAPVKVIAIDPADMAKVDANQLYGDNFYIQTNAEVGTIGAGGAGPTDWCTPVSTASPFAGCASDIDFKISPEPKGCALDGFACNDTLACATISNTCADNGAGGTDCEETGDPDDPDDDCATTADCPQNTCDDFGVYAYSLFPFGFSRAEWGFGPFGYPETEKAYTFEINAGAMVRDRCRATTAFAEPAVASNTKVTVTTNKFALATTGTFVPNVGDVIPATRKIAVNFNTPLKHTAAFAPDIDTTTFTVEPMPLQNATTPMTAASMVRFPPSGAENTLFLRGHYQPNTDYTLTFKAGTVFKDNYNKEVTLADAKVIKFKTQAISVTASSPANGATVTKAAPTSQVNVTFTFNQSMDIATFTREDIEFIGTPTNITFGTGSSATSTVPNCTISAQQCVLRVSGNYVPGEYTIKLKKDALIKDVLGNDYLQAADRTIKFTVKEATPATVLPCLGS